MSCRSMPAIATAWCVTSSTIWVSVISVLRTEGICPYPTTATSTIRTGPFRYGVPARFVRSAHASAACPSVALPLQCAHVAVRFTGRHPAFDAAVGAAPAACREVFGVALRLRAPDRGDAHADVHVADG